MTENAPSTPEAPTEAQEDVGTVWAELKPGDGPLWSFNNVAMVGVSMAAVGRRPDGSKVMVHAVCAKNACANTMNETISKLDAAYRKELVDPTPKPAPRMDIPPLCPTCEVKYYDTIHREGLHHDQYAALRDTGWVHMAERAGMIRPCQTCKGS